MSEEVFYASSSQIDVTVIRSFAEKVQGGGVVEAPLPLPVPGVNAKIQKLIAKHIFECFEKRKGADGKK